MKQYAALIEGTEVRYVQNSNGNFFFEDLEELRSVVQNSPEISGAKIFEREVSDWKLLSEILKEK